MDALTSLDRAVVWRFVEPAAADLERFSRRLTADLSTTQPISPARPFVVATPVGMREARGLQRALVVRGVTVVERRSIADWPRLTSASSLRSLDREHLRRVYAEEQVWRGLFPRGSAEIWFLDGERAFERVHAWRPGLRELARGVQVTVQHLYDSFVTELPAIHVPAPRELDREWRAFTALRAV